jgi:hypothetical protein
MPYSPLKINRSFGGESCLHVQGPKMSQARNQREAGSKMKMEATCSSETSVDFQRATQRHIPEDGDPLFSGPRFQTGPF